MNSVFTRETLTFLLKAWFIGVVLPYNCIHLINTYSADTVVIYLMQIFIRISVDLTFNLK